MLKIREANTNDAVYIALLGRITYTESHGKYIKNPSDLQTYYNNQFSVAKILEEIEDQNNIFWIVFHNDLPIGFAKLSLNNNHKDIPNKNSCRLEKIYVLNDFIGMKIGSKLKDILIAKAIDLKFNNIWLATYIKNEKAQNFYKKSGFQQVGFIDFIVGNDSYKNFLFSKNL
ncbi:MAG: N-acetyltransferase family protein [Polaribacter sp.]